MHLDRWVLLAFCLLGQIIYMLMRAGLSAGSKLTPWNSLREYWKCHWPALMFRFFIAEMFFIWWTGDPQLVDRGFDSVATNLQPGMLRSVIEGIHFPLNYGTAGIYGVLGDVGLDWFSVLIPGLRAKIPTLSEDKTEDKPKE